MQVISTETIKDFGGRIIGFIDMDREGNQQARDFYGRILGSYDKKCNVTRDFYGRIRTRGNTVMGFLYEK